MKFRYYITNILEGQVKGTNDEAVARDFAVFDDYFVVDSETGKWIAADDDTDIESVEG